MQIHELPAGSPITGMTFAGDTGTQTQKIDYDALADAILNKLTTKTFDIESESQTIIAALNALGDAAKQGVANNLVTTDAGYVLDARQGKALSDLHATNADAIAALNSRTDRYLVRGMVTVSVSLTANGTYTNDSIDISSAVPSGYSPIALYARATGSNALYVYQADIANMANRTAVLQLKNTSSSPVTASAMLIVLSAKA